MIPERRERRHRGTNGQTIDAGDDQRTAARQAPHTPPPPSFGQRHETTTADLKRLGMPRSIASGRATEQ